MKNTGRPSFLILPDRLASMRTEAKLTQLQLTDEAYKLLGTQGTEKRSRETHYQRVETSGKTSIKFADCLSRVLGERLGKNPAAVLQELRGGEPKAPPDRIDEIEAQLQSQLDGGQNEALNLLMKQFNDDDHPVRELALQLATRIEIAHIEQRQDELNDLAKIIGWTVQELLKPIGYLGHWMLISLDRGCTNTKVVLGVNEVLYEIKAEGEKWLNARYESDARVVLKADGLWFRVCIEHPRNSLLSLSFSFVRCSPSATGFSWVKPTWLDRFWIDELESWAQTNANFVVDFKQVAIPQDLRNLRLVVSKHVDTEDRDDPFSESPSNEKLLVFKGSLDDMHDEVFESFRKEGIAHSLVTNWASSGLWEELEPYLQEFPADWWRIKTGFGGIRFEIEVNISTLISRGMALNKIPHSRARFVIHLAEELPNGELRAVPWRAKDAESVAKDRLRKELQKRLDEIQVGPVLPRWIDRTQA